MRLTKGELVQNLAERLCREVAHWDNIRVARRLFREKEVDGLYRLDEGAVLADFFHFLAQIGVIALWVHYVILTRRPLEESTVVGWHEKIVDQPTGGGVLHGRGSRALL